MLQPMRFLVYLLSSLLSLPVWGAPPLADVHIHYKWSQEDVTSAQQVAAILEENAVALAVVIGTPAELALEIQRLAPQRVVPIWSPYRKPGDWSTWAHDADVIDHARKALESGQYHGIGELHLVGGFAPPPHSPVIAGLAAIAEDFDVPMLLHTEFSTADYMLKLCLRYPRVKLLWAHAGAILTPAQVADVLRRCPNVWAELSARDRWRFVNNPITGDDGALLTEWRDLIESFPDRFMVGSDPVWPVERLDSWDEPDSGWQQYGRFIAFHRGWLRLLPHDLAQKLRMDNAATFFFNQE